MRSCRSCPNCLVVEGVWAVDPKTGKLRESRAYVCVVYNFALAVGELTEDAARHYAADCPYHGRKVENNVRAGRWRTT